MYNENIVARVHHYKGKAWRKREWPDCPIHKVPCELLNRDRPLGGIVCPICYKNNPRQAIQLGAYCSVHRDSFGCTIAFRGIVRTAGGVKQVCPRCHGSTPAAHYWDFWRRDPDYLTLKNRRMPLYPDDPAYPEEWQLEEFLALPRSAEDAQAAGSTRYFEFENATGKISPCPEGHIAPRWTAKPYRCTACATQSQGASRHVHQVDRDLKALTRSAPKLKGQDLGDTAREITILADNLSKAHVINGDDAYERIKKRQGKKKAESPEASARRKRNRRRAVTNKRRRAA